MGTQILHNAVVIFTATGFYGFLHSVAASLTVKKWVRCKLGEWAHHRYRLAYNAFFTALLVPLLKITASLPDKVLYVLHPPWLYVMLAIQTLGLAIAADATFRTDVWAFLGLKPETNAEAGKLVIRGAYRWVRHPMYAGSLLIIWFMPAMTLNSALFYAALTAYIVVGAHFEERKLLAEYDEDYRKYREQVPMLVPRPPSLRATLGQITSIFSGGKHET